jgi:hypothetical protein
MRRLITEYRAKQALVDMGEWTGAVRALLNQYFWTTIKAESKPSWLTPEVWYATPYVKTTADDNGLLTPEYRTTPGWSGANQIPFHVTGERVIINFQPLAPNMTCQLCFRDTTGAVVYSNPVYGGDCILKLEKVPANGVVFAVITNTDYLYKGEVTRTAHFDYRIKPIEGIERTASVKLKWFNWNETILDTVTVGTIDVVKDLDVDVYPNPVSGNENLTLKVRNLENETAVIQIYNMQGQLVFEDKINSNNTIINKNLWIKDGIYLINVSTSTRKRNFKIVVH